MAAMIAWIDDDHVDGVGGEVAVRVGDGQRAVEDVVGLYGVADVVNLGKRVDIENDTPHGADEVIAGSEVRGEGDNALRQSDLRGVSVFEC